MPNWASTNYVVTGERKQLAKLYKKMRKIEKRVDKEKKRKDYGEYPMWELTTELGGDPDVICSRGTWMHLEYVKENGYIWIHTETAWGELGDWRNFIEDKFDVFFYYYTEEPGCVIYETNDSEGCYFPYRYMMFEEVRQEYNYYSTLSELTKDVENLLCVKGLETVEDCRKAFNGYIKEHGEICYSINEIEVVD